ncbi:hypothetical protein [Halobacteriovorax sp. RT-2-4]|uniref:hypothetical protein n=1 Tax=unclassified Halobacteriovorax TaxID=2639665 RepID=UPI00399A3B45
MRKIILFVLLFNLNALGQNFTARGGGTSTTDWDLRTGSGSTTGDWRVTDIIELNNNAIDLNTLKLSDVGEFDFDSINDRWILKTKGRILSVRNIELIDKFQEKQIEVLDYSINLKKSMRNMGTKMLEKRIQRGVKFKDYKFNDFNY